MKAVALACLLTISGATGQADESATARWAGPYVGFQVGRWHAESDPGQRMTDLIAGWTFGVGQSGFIAGAEARIGTYSDGGSSYNERYLDLVLGMALTEKVFVYGLAGAGVDDGVSVRNYGFGVDYAVSDAVSIGARAFRGEYTEGPYSWDSGLVSVKLGF